MFVHREFKICTCSFVDKSAYGQMLVFVHRATCFSESACGVCFVMFAVIQLTFACRGRCRFALIMLCVRDAYIVHGWRV